MLVKQPLAMYVVNFASIAAFCVAALIEYISQLTSAAASYTSLSSCSFKLMCVFLGFLNVSCRRAGMEGQVLAYLQVHQPERQLMMSSAPTAANNAALQQQQQAEAAAAAAAAAKSSEAMQLQHQQGEAAAAAAAASLLPSGLLAPALSAPVGGSRGVASPAASGSLNAAVAAAAAAAAAAGGAMPPSAAAAAAGGAMPPSAAAAAAANYLAGLVSPEQLQFAGAEYNAAAGGSAAAAAAMAGGMTGGPPRVKKTAKRTGMPRCFSSRNVAGELVKPLLQ
jgi:hypothetical protein